MKNEDIGSWIDGWMLVALRSCELRPILVCLLAFCVVDSLRVAADGEVGIGDD